MEQESPNDLIRSILDKKEQAPEGGIEMYVLEVLKFIHDCFSMHLGHANDPSCEGYDVILTDGQCLSKALVDKGDNPLMQKQIVVPGCKINILSLSQQSNVGNDSSGSFFQPVISKLSVVSSPVDNRQMEPAFAKLRSSEEYAACLGRPLFSHRRYYCTMWSSMDPPMEYIPAYPDSTLPTTADLMLKHTPLSEVVRGVSSTASVCYSSVVGRVLTKSGVIHYAKPTDQYSSPYPFQFYVELCDGTRSVPAVFWNGNCLKWYREVHVGDVLAVSRFTVRDVQDARASTYNRLTQLRHSSDSHQVELNLNCDRSPLAEIRKVSEDDVPSSVHLPEMSVDVNYISAVLKAEEPVMGAVGGVVSYVSRLERTHRLNAPPGVLPGRPPPPQDRKILPFVQYRWVALVDPSSSSPLLVQVTSCSQPEEFAQIVVGRVLVITNANVWPHLLQLDSSAPKDRTVFAATSLESQVCVRAGMCCVCVCLCVYVCTVCVYVCGVTGCVLVCTGVCGYLHAVSHDAWLLQLYLVDGDCPSFLIEELEGLLTWRQTSRCRDALKRLSSDLHLPPTPLLPNNIPQLQLLIGQPNSDIEVSRSINSELMSNNTTVDNTH